MGTEDVTLDGGTAAFDTKDVGADKTVTLTGASLAGADAGNYTLGSVDTATADITSRPVVGSFTAADKDYDGGVTATITGRSLGGVPGFPADSGVVGTETVSLTGGTATFDNKNVGEDKTVTGTGFALDGADAGNYSLLSSTLQTTADIDAKSLTGSFTAADKVFDNSTAATVTGRSLSGVVGTEDVTLTGGTATFDTKDVGANKTVTLTGASLAGADMSNYSLGSVNTTTADITYAATGANCYGGPGRTILQPINANGTSVFKAGSTVPAKFRVCDAFGNSIGAAGVVSSFKLVERTSVSGIASVNEDPISTTPDTAFRWSALDQQWIFNINTKKGDSNTAVKYLVTLNDGTTFDFKFALK